MSKYDAGQLNFAALCIDGKKIAADHGGLVAELDGTVVADMLREYAAHLAAQAEWPSEAAEDFLELVDRWCRPTSEAMQHLRAALQSVRPPATNSSEVSSKVVDAESVRPPVGVVSDVVPCKSSPYPLPEGYRLVSRYGVYWPIFDDAYITASAQTRAGAAISAWKHAHDKMRSALDAVQHVVASSHAPTKD